MDGGMSVGREREGERREEREREGKRGREEGREGERREEREREKRMLVCTLTGEVRYKLVV